MKIFKRILLAFLLILSMVVVGFFIWVNSPADPEPPVAQAMQSSSSVTVTTEPWLMFMPKTAPTTGLIIYPGARVTARAYAPTAHAAADAGYLAVIVPMPSNMAIFAPSRADEVIAAHPEIKHWAIAGHSLGGSMAAQYAHADPAKVQGLILWASFPAKKDDLSATPIITSVLYGSDDGLAQPSQVLASKPYLPATTQWIEIKGGNHAQFGWYGEQAGDNAATISHEEQQRIINEEMIKVLQTISQH